LIGTRLGKILIQEQLGSGGMGQVFLGFDETLERHVAVKVIRKHRRTQTDSRIRFIREAKILSKLEHPNICRIYDYLVEDDGDYIVMEYIQGKDLEETLARGLSDAEKLKIAIQVCEVLAEAHAKNIIHRDLKPANVMLTPEGEAKVLDFGIAHSMGTTQANLGESGVRRPVPTSGDESTADGFDTAASEAITKELTQQGDIVGTPMFMSPEQARGKRISHASDMYCFGLLLQWLFTEKKPFPSNSTIMLLRDAAKARSLPVEGVDSELKTTINRLKSPAPGARPTAAQTLEKLKWIQARRSRLIKRVIAIAFIVLLVVGTTASMIGFMRARESERIAQLERETAMQHWEKANTINRFLLKTLLAANPDQMGIDVKVVEVLNAASDQVDVEMADHPYSQSLIHHTLGNTYVGLGLYDKALFHYERALEIRRKEMGEEDITTLDTLSDLANLHSLMGNYEKVEVMLPQALELSRKKLGTEHQNTLTLMNNLGVFYMNRMDYARAETIYREIVETKTRVLGGDHPNTIGSVSNWALCLKSLGRYEEAIEVFERYLEQVRASRGEAHPSTGLLMSNLAWTLDEAGRHSESEKLHRKVLALRRETLGEMHPHTLWTKTMLANVLRMQGRYDAAQRLHLEALEGKRQVLGKTHPETIISMAELATTLSQAGHSERAQEIAKSLLEMRQEIHLNDDLRLALRQLSQALGNSTFADAIRQWLED